MKIEQTGPGDRGFSPYLLLKEDRSAKAEIDDYPDEESATAAYERLVRVLGDSSRSRFEAVSLVRVLRHADISPG